jgi:hypothetical protein
VSVEAKNPNKVFVDVSLSFSHVLLLPLANRLGFIFCVLASFWICQYALVFLRGYVMDHFKQVGRSREHDPARQRTTPNRLYRMGKRHREGKESSHCRMRWVAQVSESRPIARLTSMSEDEMTLVVPGDYAQRLTSPPSQLRVPYIARHFPRQKEGPDCFGWLWASASLLLTIATQDALTKYTVRQCLPPSPSKLISLRS